MLRFGGGHLRPVDEQQRHQIMTTSIKQFSLNADDVQFIYDQVTFDNHEYRLQRRWIYAFLPLRD